MYVVVFFKKEEKENIHYGTSYDTEKTREFVKYLLKMKNPETFFIVYSDGKTIKEVSVLDFVLNDYSFDRIGKIVREFTR